MGTPDVEQLRRLLFGKDYDDLLAMKRQFENSDKYSASVAAIISEAIRLRSSQDDSLADVLAPTVEQALTHSIGSNPKRVADMLYPVMGPAIRKSINQALGEALENLNQLLESSVSPRSWKWRFDAWRTGQSYAQVALLHTLVYRVEQVFLIHRETGLLLQHVESPQVTSKNPMMVSGMLTAIQDFIADSFGVEQDDGLRTMTLGGMTVLVENSPMAILAVVVRGNVPSELHQQVRNTITAIHSRYTAALKAFSGDTTAFASTQDLLSECLQSRQQPQQKRSPWLAWSVLLGLCGLLVYAGYARYQAQQLRSLHEMQAKQEHQRVLDTLNQRLVQLQTHTTELQNSLNTLTDQQRQQLAEHTQQRTVTQQTIHKLIQQIEGSQYPFELGKAEVALDHPHVVELSKTIRDLIANAHKVGTTPQVMIVGNADNSGSEELNKKLTEQRAENLRDALVRSGVPAFAIVAYSANLAGRPAMLQKNERSTNYRVELF